jgi:hypothetical protein
MKAYSIDLRQKIIDASENELLSQRQMVNSEKSPEDDGSEELPSVTRSDRNSL